MTQREELVQQRLFAEVRLKGISIRNLAAQLGIPQKNLNNQINGTVTMSIDTLVRILEFYQDISSDLILRGVVSEKKETVLENNYKSPHHNSNGSGVQNIGSDQAEVIKAKDLMIEELKRDKDELRKDKDYLMEVIRNLQKQ